MAELVVLQHVEREGPGLLAERALARGWGVTLHRCWRGERWPDPDRDDAVWAVLGGPMGVGDFDDPRFPWLVEEVELVQRRVAAGLPILGICLGAQLLAHAAGGGAAPLRCGDPPAPLREVGFGAVTWTRSPLEEPVLQGLDPSQLVLHWHGDRIHLPPTATLLASSLLCPEQMFRIGRVAYGLQFHIEVTAEALERWLVEDGAFVAAALGPAGVERVRADGRRWLQAAHGPWCCLIDNLLTACAAQPDGEALDET
jgi:GMP synthase (glutamine-hydrolysing)